MMQFQTLKYVRVNQGSQTRGPPDVFIRPALSSKFPLTWIKLQFYEVLEYFLVLLWPAETFLPTCAARELFFYQNVALVYI